MAKQMEMANFITQKAIYTKENSLTVKFTVKENTYIQMDLCSKVSGSKVSQMVTA